MEMKKNLQDGYKNTSSAGWQKKEVGSEIKTKQT